MTEGYIKFNAVWTKAPPLSPVTLKELQYWRQEMYRQQLIGAYEDGIGYGNISLRADDGGSFIITGSKTGILPVLSPKHYTTVAGFDVSGNTVYCTGPIIASSESMSHAILYRECPEIKGVIHVHHFELWEYLTDRVPTTDAKATYGSPEMVESIADLLARTQLRKEKIFVMKGHPEGIFVFGENLREAASILMLWLKKAGIET